METTFTLRKDELDAEFLESLKRLFKNSRELQITVSAAIDFDLNKTETPVDYVSRLEKAAQNLKTGQNRVVMTDEQFDDLSINLLR